MQESMLIVPKNDNDGNSLAALTDTLAGEMCDSFGGVTCRDATGMWRDALGKLYREPVTELVSACADTADTEHKLTKLALQVCRDGRQHAAYVRFPSGRVRIITADNRKHANDNGVPQ